MTPEERKQWNLYSCVPRCIIKLAELRGTPMSDDEFVDRFVDKVPEWKNRFGLTGMNEALSIVAELNLADRAVHISDVPALQDFVNKGNTLDHALVLTHRMRSQKTGNLDELHHCRLFLGFEKGTPNFVLQHPNQDGTESALYESVDSLIEQQAEFIVLYRPPANGKALHVAAQKHAPVRE